MGTRRKYSSFWKHRTLRPAIKGGAFFLTGQNLSRRERINLSDSFLEDRLLDMFDRLANEFLI